MSDEHCFTCDHSLCSHISDAMDKLQEQLAERERKHPCDETCPACWQLAKESTEARAVLAEQERHLAHCRDNNRALLNSSVPAEELHAAKRKIVEQAKRIDKLQRQLESKTETLSVYRQRIHALTEALRCAREYIHWLHRNNAEPLEKCQYSQCVEIREKLTPISDPPAQPSDVARWHLCRHDILKTNCAECKPVQPEGPAKEKA